MYALVRQRFRRRKLDIVQLRNDVVQVGLVERRTVESRAAGQPADSESPREDLWGGLPSDVRSMSVTGKWARSRIDTVKSLLLEEGTHSWTPAALTAVSPTAMAAALPHVGQRNSRPSGGGGVKGGAAINSAASRPNSTG